MTIQNLIDLLSENQGIAIGYYVTVILLTFVISQVVNQNNFNSIKYIMCGLVYAATIPGILAVILTLYSLLIQKTDLLTVSIITYFVPIITMVVTLFIISKKVSMTRIPGFGRLTGLMIMIGVTFLIVFVLQRTYFGVLFIGGFFQLLIAFSALLIIIKIGWTRLMK